MIRRLVVALLALLMPSLAAAEEGVHSMSVSGVAYATFNPTATMRGLRVEDSFATGDLRRVTFALDRIEVMEGSLSNLWAFSVKHRWSRYLAPRSRLNFDLGSAIVLDQLESGLEPLVTGGVGYSHRIGWMWGVTTSVELTRALENLLKVSPEATLYGARAGLYLEY